MSPKKPSAPAKAGSRKTASKVAAKSSDGGPADAPRGERGDPATIRAAQAEGLARALPFNAGKAREHGRENALAPPQGYVGWQALFASQAMKLATFVFVLGMLLHAWIGLRDVLADYVPHVGLRSLLRKLVTLALLALAAWTWLILWSVAA